MAGTGSDRMCLVYLEKQRDIYHNAEFFTMFSKSSLALLGTGIFVRATHVDVRQFINCT